jgi:hypothetical protein
MTQTLDTPVAATASAEPTVTYEPLGGRGVGDIKGRLEPFLSELAKMTREERIRASRYSFNRWERWVWAARYPDEVPIVNGEFEWIALSLA